jgi:8-amino-7-oxononanoate synthase
MNDSLECYLQNNLSALERGSLRRALPELRFDGVKLWQNGKEYISFASNDYLGVLADCTPPLSGKFGAGASRLVTGNHHIFAELERAVAGAKSKQAALVYGSGYLANIGAISGLMRDGDLIMLDKLSHACMIDGARLSKAEVKRYAHNNLEHLRQLLQKYRASYKHCLIATESIFSMDGDISPIAQLRGLVDEYDAWLLVDDAHGYGFKHLRLELADIVVGTFSKAVGTYGGYVVGSENLREFLINNSRSFMFTTALPEALCLASLHNIKMIEAQPERAEAVLEYEREICEALNLPIQNSPIIPIIIGDNAKMLQVGEHLKMAGLWVGMIRPPTVPNNTARLRISLSAAHSQAQIDYLIKCLKKTLVD